MRRCIIPGGPHQPGVLRPAPMWKLLFASVPFAAPAVQHWPPGLFRICLMRCCQVTGFTEKKQLYDAVCGILLLLAIGQWFNVCYAHRHSKVNALVFFHWFPFTRRVLSIPIISQQYGTVTVSLSTCRQSIVNRNCTLRVRPCAVAVQFEVQESAQSLNICN